MVFHTKLLKLAFCGSIKCVYALYVFHFHCYDHENQTILKTYKIKTQSAVTVG